MQFLGLLNKARHALAVVKATATADFVTDCVAAGQKMVVFTSYTAVVDTMRERFGDTCVTLTGKDTTAQRDAAVHRFQTDESVRVFVGNLLAAGVGITLTAGTHVVFNDLDWVPANHWQAEDRVHRIGQTESTFATYIHAAGTLDEPVAALLEQKAATIATLEDAARDHASIVDAVVELALDGPAHGVHTDPAVAAPADDGSARGDPRPPRPVRRRAARRPCGRGSLRVPERQQARSGVHGATHERRRRLRLPRVHLQGQLQAQPRRHRTGVTC